jgi:2-(1,2-epoxy-1,2-dihydrophenyl)acetyl-CoA isomerase
MSEGAGSTVQVSQRDGVCTILLNRPEALNAFTRELHAELREALRAAERDREARVVVIGGAGRAFCVGQDLKEVDPTAGRALGAELGKLLRANYNPLISRIRSLEKPVIAAINGAAAGAGLSLALACDLRLASSAASFVTAFGALGLVPDSGGLYTLPRLVGTAKAFELFALSERLAAAEALRIGLVNQVLPAEGFGEAVQAFAARLAAGPTLAYGLLKRGLARSAGSDLDGMLELEAQYQELAGRSEDFQEGLAAFLEKRRPSFRGR